MPNKILLSAAAAAFVLSSVTGAGVAMAATPGVKAEQKAANEKNPAVSDKIISKYEAKDAKKQAKRAHRKAKLAAKKAKAAEKVAAAQDKPPPAH